MVKEKNYLSMLLTATQRQGKLSDFFFGVCHILIRCFMILRWRETYSFGIRPLNGQLEWPRTNRLGVIPPPNRAGNPGRPKNHDRKKSQNESETKMSRAHRSVTCSNCKEEGHNKITCPNDFQEPPAKKPRGRPKKNQVWSYKITSSLLCAFKML